MVVDLLRAVWRFFSLRNLIILNCVVLVLGGWFYYVKFRIYFESMWLPPEAFFVSSMEPHIAELINRTFLAFVETMNANNVTFFIFSGSLIGSVRHHGMIPWDDDIDVIVNITDMERVSLALSKTDPNVFGYYNWSDRGENYAYQWKFFPKKGQKMDGRDYRSPYVDIFFFLENDTYIWNGSPFVRDEVWPKNTVFPLRPRPFGDLMLLAPCNPEAFLAINYNISQCRSRDFSHLHDIKLMFTRTMYVPCERLSNLHPLVRKSISHSKDSSGKPLVDESLTFKGVTLKRFTSEARC